MLGVVIDHHRPGSPSGGSGDLILGGHVRTANVEIVKSEGIRNPEIFRRSPRKANIAARLRSFRSAADEKKVLVNKVVAIVTSGRILVNREVGIAE